MRTSNERGIAMITTLLMMMLISALLIGFTTVVMSDQRFRSIDRDRSQAFYAAAAGVEKLTADFGNLFFTKIAPSASEITQLQGSDKQPSISGVSFLKADGTSGYTLTKGTVATQNISKGPYAGLIALITPYTIDVTARTSNGGEVHLQRQSEAVAIPVFQFGIFSDLDLSFFSGDDFDFGGRIHTNGNLFLAQKVGTTLTSRDKVTAFKEIVRKRWQNNLSISTAYSTGTIKQYKSTSTFDSMLDTDGSVQDGVNSSLNPNWKTISESKFNSYIRNYKNGVARLDLPLITVGGFNTDLIRRPLSTDDPNSVIFGERMFKQASLRVLLSDRASDIANLPGIDTSVAPAQLENWTTGTVPTGLTVDATHYPVALSRGPIAMKATNGALSAGTGLTIPLSTSNGWTGLLPYAKLPANMVLATATPQTINCTGKNNAAGTQFTGCTALTAPAANGTAINVTLANGTPVTTHLTAAAALGATTLTVNASESTAFSANTFWVRETNSLVTCLGYNTTNQLLGCASPVALPANVTLTTNQLSEAGIGLLGGFIKIEYQDTSNAWHDVTAQILNFGIGDKSQTNTGANGCADPTPNAILRIQRLRDYASNTPNIVTTPSNSNCPTFVRNPHDYVPNMLFDTREAINRNVSPGDSDNLRLGGIMHYIAIDTPNLIKWFKGQAPYASGSGTSAKTDNGYSVYFSDRRNNRNASGEETGEYGNEDSIDPTQATVTGSGGLPQAGEDLNANNTLEIYGAEPNFNAVYNAVPTLTNYVPVPASITGSYWPMNPLTTSAHPQTDVPSGIALSNRAILFRRALKLIKGQTIDAVGLTIAAENPVYIEGNWNGSEATFSGTHAATSVIADAVTVLSNSWKDLNSFNSPYDLAGRQRTLNTFYRVAVIAGKGPAFEPTGWTAPITFGTDGGAMNFLRYLEDGAGEVHYRGSLASFYFNRQATGVFKWGTASDLTSPGFVYDYPPLRKYAFDTDFLDPAKLPPLTPVFRDLNTITFKHETRPGR